MIDDAVVLLVSLLMSLVLAIDVLVSSGVAWNDPVVTFNVVPLLAVLLVSAMVLDSVVVAPVVELDSVLVKTPLRIYTGK